MVRDNVAHKTKGYCLGDADWFFQQAHLKEEVQELLESTTRDGAVEEICDVLGVLLHMAVFQKAAPQELTSRLLKKLRTRFDEPRGGRAQPGERGEADEYRKRFGCLACGEDHPRETMCPPHEVRTTGQAWFTQRISAAEKSLAEDARKRVLTPTSGEGCELPTEPGVWERNGECWGVSLRPAGLVCYPIPAPNFIMLLSSPCSEFGSVKIPRGGWRRLQAGEHP